MAPLEVGTCLGPYGGPKGECYFKSYTYRGNSIIGTPPPPRTTKGPWAWGYCRVLRGGLLLMSKVQPLLAQKVTHF